MDDINAQDVIETAQLFAAKIFANHEYLVLILAPSIVLLTVFLGFYLFFTKRKAEDQQIIKELEETADAVDGSKGVSLPKKDETSVAEASKPQKSLQTGLEKTRGKWLGALSTLFSSRATLDDDQIKKLHETLFRSDVGVKVTNKLVQSVQKSLKGKDVDWNDIQDVLKSQIVQNLKDIETPEIWSESLNGQPKVLMVVGVNGAGKTTSIAKLTSKFLEQGQSVLLVAADTYRAAAIDQLKVWGDRLGVEVIAQKQGADPAAVAFDGVKAGKARGIDIVIVDTAGRLHSKKELMDELHKIHRVVGKEVPKAPHETWLVMDATTGQNGLMQVKAFTEATDLTGIIVSKLDGTAKGGVVLAVAEETGVPVRFVGVGEKAEDLKEFEPEEFAAGFFGA